MSKVGKQDRGGNWGQGSYRTRAGVCTACYERCTKAPGLPAPARTAMSYVYKLGMVCSVVVVLVLCCSMEPVARLLV